MSVKINDWLPDLMPRLPGITEEFLLLEIFSAVRQLCEDGRAWTELFGPLSSKANNPTIYLDPLFQNARVGYVWRATFRGNSNVEKILTPAPQAPLIRNTAIEPRAFMMVGPGTVELIPTPNQDWDNRYRFDLSVIPTAATVYLPDYFMTHWQDAVIDGTCGRCMSMISKPWTNQQQAIIHNRLFRNHIKRCRAITSSKFSTGQAWTYPDFARQRTGGGAI
ncbi:MAG: hypothetical protein DRI24_01715 [Deltaproteobacteria bacterium]|nr:MAG: hypothetical protein DRI24_01715 [Deltaproteobacteria bacterium]